MSAPEEAKKVGLKNLKEMGSLVDQTPKTLSYWELHKPELFEAALKLAVDKKERISK